MRTEPCSYIPCPELHVFDDVDKLKKFATKNYSCEVEATGKDGCTITLSSNDGELSCLVHIKRRKYSQAQLSGLAAHEATHVSQSFFDFIGEQSPSSEMQAYYIQAFTMCIIEAYEKLTKGSKQQ